MLNVSLGNENANKKSMYMLFSKKNAKKKLFFLGQKGCGYGQNRSPLYKEGLRLRPKTTTLPYWKGCVLGLNRNPSLWRAAVLKRNPSVLVKGCYGKNNWPKTHPLGFFNRCPSVFSTSVKCIYNLKHKWGRPTCTN